MNSIKRRHNNHLRDVTHDLREFTKEKRNAKIIKRRASYERLTDASSIYRKEISKLKKQFDLLLRLTGF